jgi:hypothetical protein
MGKVLQQFKLYVGHKNNTNLTIYSICTDVIFC